MDKVILQSLRNSSVSGNEHFGDHSQEQECAGNIIYNPSAVTSSCCNHLQNLLQHLKFVKYFNEKI